MSKPLAIDRRKFISRSVTAALGAGVAGFGGTAAAQTVPPADPAPAESKIRSFRTLGRTGFKVSDISTGFCNNTTVLKAIFAAGVNYIDTAESYGNQRAVGQALQGLDRKSVFITSKLEIEADASKENFLRRFSKCLEELQTDYLDCLMMHMPERAELLATPGFHQAMEQLKKEGKLRFTGVSHHGPNWFRAPEESMEKVLLAAAADGRFDVFLMAYNFLQREAGQKVLEACAAKKIGVTLMKVNPAGKYQGLKDRVEALKKEGKEVDPLYIEGLERFAKLAGEAESFIRAHKLTSPRELGDAAIRFVLDAPEVHTVCCAMRNFDDMQRFVGLSGTTLSAVEAEKLSAWRQGPAALYCRHACGECEPSCPHGVPVNTIMRFHHYYAAQGREKWAMAQYAKLESAKADACRHCSGLCERACPHHVPVQGMLALAHQRLSLS
jgi:predicted aldo/keto reductase-like oxidoreductase